VKWKGKDNNQQQSSSSSSTTTDNIQSPSESALFDSLNADWQEMSPPE
jgi:hypothetical protein